jgi:Tfp pilus assembly protein PilN
VNSEPSRDAEPRATSGPAAPGKENKPRVSGRRLLITTFALGIVLVLGFGVGLVVLAVTNSDKLKNFNDARADLVTVQAATTDLLHEADTLEPDTLTDLEAQLENIEMLLAEESPGSVTLGLDDRIAAISDGIRGVEDLTASLETAIEHRSQYESQLSEAEGDLAEAEELLESTSGKVLDADLHDELANNIDTLKETVERAPDATSGESFETLTTELVAAADEVSRLGDEVSDTHEDWLQAEKEREEAEREREEAERQAEEEAAQMDPATYESPSERDWALVERDPDSHTGEKYMLYGYVTQADAATGNFTIRVETSPTQKYRWYDYDVNTVVFAGDEDVFSNVVQGDHVKMLVEVNGALTYDTVIGGSLTAVSVTAYDMKVLGQL